MSLKIDRIQMTKTASERFSIEAIFLSRWSWSIFFPRAKDYMSGLLSFANRRIFFLDITLWSHIYQEKAWTNFQSFVRFPFANNTFRFFTFPSSLLIFIRRHLYSTSFWSTCFIRLLKVNFQFSRFCYPKLAKSLASKKGHEIWNMT